MEKIKTFIKEVNILAVFSFTTAVLALYYWFTPRECSIALSLIGLEAFIMGVISLVRIETKKQRGELFAILGMMMGLLTIVLFKTCR